MSKPKFLTPKKELQELQFNIVFETLIDKVSDGANLTYLLATDHRKLPLSGFLKWVNRNPELKRRLEEAQEIGAEILAAETIMISDGIDPNTGEPSMEEIERSALRIKSRQWLAGMYSKRFKNNKDIEITTISLTQAMQEADSRVNNLKRADIIDV